MPTASTHARSYCARRSAAADVIGVRAPGCRADAAVDACRRFQDDERPAVADRRQKRLIQPDRCVTAHADDDLDAVLAQRANPRPLTCGNGSSMAATTRRMPAAMIRSVHGPVRPMCAHGSSVQYSVAPRAASPASSSACTSACASPARSCAPCPTTTPSSETMHAPTIGIRRRAPRAPPRAFERPIHPARRPNPSVATTSPETARPRIPAPKTESGRRGPRRRRRT